MRHQLGHRRVGVDERSSALVVTGGGHHGPVRAQQRDGGHDFEGRAPPPVGRLGPQPRDEPGRCVDGGLAAVLGRAHEAEGALHGADGVGARVVSRMTR